MENIYKYRFCFCNSKLTIAYGNGIFLYLFLLNLKMELKMVAITVFGLAERTKKTEVYCMAWGEATSWYCIVRWEQGDKDKIYYKI
jgi:hypothetical protein